MAIKVESKLWSNHKGICVSYLGACDSTVLFCLHTSPLESCTAPIKAAHGSLKSSTKNDPKKKDCRRTSRELGRRCTQLNSICLQRYIKNKSGSAIQRLLLTHRRGFNPDPVAQSNELDICPTMCSNVAS